MATKAKFPRKIKIGHESHKCNLVTEDYFKKNGFPITWGLSSYGRQWVKVSKAIPLRMRQEVLLHEIMHQLFARTGLRHKHRKNEEVIVDTLARELLSVLRDNPVMVKYMLK